MSIPYLTFCLCGVCLFAGILIGLGIHLVVDWTELTAYRRVTRRYEKAGY